MKTSSVESDAGLRGWIAQHGAPSDGKGTQQERTKEGLSHSGAPNYC